MADSIKDVVRLKIAAEVGASGFLANSIRGQRGVAVDTKRLITHDNDADTILHAVSDDSLQCLLAGTQTLSGAKTFSEVLKADGDIILANDGKIGSETTPAAMTIADTGMVTIAELLVVSKTLYAQAGVAVTAPAVYTHATRAGLVVNSADNEGDGNFGAALFLGQPNGSAGIATGSAMLSYQDGADNNVTGIIFANHPGTSSSDPRVEVGRFVGLTGDLELAYGLAVTGLLTATGGIAIPDNKGISFGDDIALVQSDVDGLESLKLTMDACGSTFIIEDEVGNNIFYIENGGYIRFGAAVGPTELILLGSGNFTMGTGSIYVGEKGSASIDVAGLGQLWVKTATPNELWFTDDAGTDHQLAYV